ncbi:arylsulfatase [Lentisphaera profundi]|uniref:Arylsulfatase n=1 Tax=Lentisphaera profundi TaxID=1658616 RepID=A0ABY7VWU2_9BACT|nr:arylsulfatase [Lentisphaera profundi]WDE97739.1 arylsulfatase [Lentisphaera profundi]
MKQLINILMIVTVMLCPSLYAQERPNIIVILVDDMGYSDLGAFGGEVDTPHIDSLAVNGLRFTQNYNSARCCPSRASLLSGLYSHQTGLADFTGPDKTAKQGPAYLGHLNNTCVTLAEVLKTAGYSTYGVGKWHVGKEEVASPTNRGFDEYYGYTDFHGKNQWMYNTKNRRGGYNRMPEGREHEIKYTKETFYATDAFTDYSLEFIKQGVEKKKPFFLYLAHSSPHFPVQAPAATRDKYLERYRKGWDVLRDERFKRQKEIGLSTDAWKFTDRSYVPKDPNGKHGPIDNGYGGKPNPAWDTLDVDTREDLAYRMALFAAMIDHVDQGVGKIIAQLKALGEFENTLILFTSDNGACYEWGPLGFDGGSRQGEYILHKGDALKTMGLNVRGEKEMSVGSAWANLSNTPLRLYKHFNHEGGNCSPLIAHWPKGIKNPDRWVRTPIHLMDYMSTICDASGAKYPETFNGNTITPTEGTSLKPIFDGDQELPERTIYFDHFNSSAIRKGPWKLVRPRFNKRNWELYNIDEDRCETNDLSKTHPEMAKAMEKQWLDWAKRVKIFPYYQHQAKDK